MQLLLQQSPLPVQAVPLGFLQFPAWCVPEAQQTSVPVQATQVPPLLPHCALVGGDTQVLPAQQPFGQLVWPHDAWAGWHTPLTQLSPSGQPTQAPVVGLHVSHLVASQAVARHVLPQTLADGQQTPPMHWSVPVQVETHLPFIGSHCWH